MEKKRSRPRRQAGTRAGISRESLLQLAAEVADREGLPAVTLARLAGLSDVQTPTVSYHVGSLQELRADLALRAVEELAEAVRVAMQGERGTDAVRAAYRAYRAYVHAHPGRYTASIETPEPNDARRLEAAGRLTAQLKGAFDQIGLHDDDAIRAARLLRAAVHGYATLELSAAWQTPLDHDATFEWLLGVILDGLTSGSNAVF